MSPAVLDRPMVAAPRGRAAGSGTGDRPAIVGSREVTLGGLVGGAWRTLQSHRDAGCPICGGQMVPRYGASGVAPVGGRCTNCGTTLG